MRAIKTMNKFNLFFKENNILLIKFMDYLAQLSDAAPVCEPPLSFSSVIILVIISCVLGLLWAAFNFRSVIKINVESDKDDDSDPLIQGVTEHQRKLLIELG
jgi:hypothetical protein